MSAASISFAPSLTPQRCTSLEEVRACIDEVDDRIVELIAQRGAYVARAACFKTNRRQAPALDRVQLVLERVKRRAEAVGLDVQVAEATYRAMINAFIDWETPQIMAQSDP